VEEFRHLEKKVNINVMENKKTYLDVINETVKYYSADPKNRRSLGEKGNCLYNGPDGKQCAFARCAEPIDSKHEGEAAIGLLIILGKDILKPEYRHLEDEIFWYKLQTLHDGDNFWTNAGLSKEGKEFVVALKVLYS